MRLIDADALLMFDTWTWFDEWGNCTPAGKIIMDAPTIDAEPVVRCKDCKHRHGFDCPMYDEQWFTIDEGDGYYDSDFRIVDVTEDDGFCDCGERGEP